MSTGKAEATPGYRLASHLRDMAKWSYVRPDDHVARLYAAAAIVESYDALKSREAVLVEALRDARRALECAINAAWEAATPGDVSDNHVIKKIDAALAQVPK
jgi:hypothetical protein